LDGANFVVRNDGQLQIAGATVAQLELVDAAPESLQVVSAGHYRSDAAAALVDGELHVRQGYLEKSNVDPLTEMVDMMGVVRHVEASQQLIRAYDEILDNAISTLGQY
jgi:flagellar basal-body rod protein FlgF